MIVFKDNGLSKKEEAQIFGLLQEVNDPYSDAYITKNNIRLFIRENFDVLKTCLKQGDKISFNEKGLAVVVGYSDKAPRKYLKLLIKDLEDAPGLVKKLYWHLKEDLFCKVKNNNPLKDVLLSNGFRFIGGRGKEVLLVHHYVARPAPTYTFSKDRDEDE
jgi:hypothetical protein